MKIETDNATAEFKFTFGDEEVEIVLEFHASENADKFMSVPMFAQLVANATLGVIQSDTSE
jgi:hypothetical protein